MSSIDVINITVKNPNGKFTDNFEFEIVFECLTPLQKGIEWKVIYIGSAESEKYDQELDLIEISPLQVGTMRFALDSEAPDYKKIPHNELIGVTAILLCCSYRSQEFFRCGYYINNSYDNEEMNLNNPETPILDKINRSILADKPRITKFNIDWNDEDKQDIPVFSATDNKTNNFMFSEGKMDVQKFNSLNAPNNLDGNNNIQNPFNGNIKP